MRSLTTRVIMHADTLLLVGEATTEPLCVSVCVQLSLLRRVCDRASVVPLPPLHPMDRGDFPPSFVFFNTWELSHKIAIDQPYLCDEIIGVLFQRFLVTFPHKYPREYNP